MKRKEVLYAVLGGCFGTLVTMGVGLFTPMSVGAQNQDVVFRKITCTKINVVDSSSKVGCAIASLPAGAFPRRCVVGSIHHGASSRG